MHINWQLTLYISGNTNVLGFFVYFVDAPKCETINYVDIVEEYMFNL